MSGNMLVMPTVERAEAETLTAEIEDSLYFGEAKGYRYYIIKKANNSWMSGIKDHGFVTPDDCKSKIAAVQWALLAIDAMAQNQENPE